MFRFWIFTLICTKGGREIKKLSNEMVDTLRESVWNKIDQEVTDERWNNIGFAAQAMVESEVPEQQILNMLIKYWDLRPSEAKDVLRFAKKNSFRE